MINLLTVIGARPQIIKAAAFSRVVKEKFSSEIHEKILHTGQHYDDSMSSVFFTEMGIPNPDFNLGVGSCSQGKQTARMIEGIEEVLLSEHFDGVVLYGDTNSTLAGAVAASKMHVPVFHIEAGLRSYNMSMPEEVNRIVCDNLSSILFAPTVTAVENLKREGFSAASPVRFSGGKNQLVRQVGDVMYDNSLYYASQAETRSTVLKRLGLEKGSYVLATVHRDFNTDRRLRLSSIFKALLYLADSENIKIVIPLHPRTKKAISSNLEDDLLVKLSNCGNIVITPPAGFFDIINLERNAKVVMTDSGGVQKEAFFYGRPCVILRPETEWIEIIDHGAGILADADFERIVEAYRKLVGREIVFPPLFGDGHASEHIAEMIVDYLN